MQTRPEGEEAGHLASCTEFCRLYLSKVFQFAFPVSWALSLLVWLLVLLFFILLVMVAFPFILSSFPGRQLAFLQLLLSIWTLRSHLRLCPASSKLCELGGTATLSVLSFLYLERKKKKESKGLLRFISGGHYAY